MHKTVFYQQSFKHKYTDLYYILKHTPTLRLAFMNQRRYIEKVAVFWGMYITWWTEQRWVYFGFQLLRIHARTEVPTSQLRNAKSSSLACVGTKLKWTFILVSFEDERVVCFICAEWKQVIFPSIWVGDNLYKE